MSILAGASRNESQLPDDCIPPSLAEAAALLARLGAPARLRRHGELVAGAAAELLDALRALSVFVNEPYVLAGAMLHDAGKVEHPQELHSPGHQHESAGRQMLLAANLHHALARVCETHAQWRNMDCTLEELIVVLADKLWKGRREADAELLVIDRVAARLSVDRFDVYPALDADFERIASAGDERLRISLQQPTD